MKRLILFLILFYSGTSYGQGNLFTPSDSLNKKRLKHLIFAESIGYSSSLILLNEIWYKQYPKSKFHLFNDGNEWLQMDKMGHGMTGYFLGLAGIEAMKWTGLSHKKAAWYGGSLGLIVLSSYEVLDGLSEQWGFSLWDMAANSTGTALVIGQELLWKEQRIKFKYSAHLTDFATERPNLLGSSFPERMLKDYNGQTYWASVNIKSFLKKESNFPSWINIAIGYGSEGMLTGSKGESYVKDGVIITPISERYRQYFLSFDIDLTKIPTKSGFLRTTFKALNFIKIPFPAIEFNKWGRQAFWLYF